ncbi:MAG: TetR family transcriptional regulator [Nocardiopsaceae bacterium]|nr:TetR family transcriptional regulator [Nocardiopsaceae bacterium]
MTTRQRQRLSEAERRAQILRATIAVVAAHGLDGASTNLIAEQARVSKGLIWHYFADKNDLMKQAVLAALAEIQRKIAAELDLSMPVPDLLRSAIRWVAAWSTANRAVLTATNQIARNLRLPDGTPAFSLADYEELYQLQEALFRRGQEEGWFREFDTRVMAVTYQGAVDAMLGYFESHPDVDTDRYATTLADILLAAMMSGRSFTQSGA